MSPLLQMDSLEYVSLYGIETLDLIQGTENAKTLQELREWDVVVNLEIDSNPELYINEVTEKSVKLSWDPMLPKDQGNYTLTLYSSDYSEVLDEVTLEATETSYEFTELDAETTYFIEVVDESEDHFGLCLN